MPNIVSFNSPYHASKSLYVSTSASMKILVKAFSASRQGEKTMKKFQFFCLLERVDESFHYGKSMDSFTCLCNEIS